MVPLVRGGELLDVVADDPFTLGAGAVLADTDEDPVFEVAEFPG